MVNIINKDLEVKWVYKAINISPGFAVLFNSGDNKTAIAIPCEMADFSKQFIVYHQSGKATTYPHDEIEGLLVNITDISWQKKQPVLEMEVEELRI